MSYRVLAINPGGTSTKVAVFDGDNALFSQSIRHPSEKVESFRAIFDQYEWRKTVIEEVLKENNVELEKLDAVVGRGGMLKGVEGGTYSINDEMLKDLKDSRLWGVLQHSSNLGAFIAKAIGDALRIPSFIVDPVTVDELSDIARVTGVPEITRIFTFHPLNHRYTARKLAQDLGKPLEMINLIGAHLGSGISVAAIEKGRIVDVNPALLGFGPFTPQRAGTLMLREVLNMAYSGDYTHEELISKLTTKSGLIGYLGTDDTIEVVKRIDEGDAKAELVLKAMCYQISKEIGARAAVLEGNVEGIYITGGLANSSFIVEEIVRRIKFIAPTHVIPGENEMEALTQGVIRVLEGKEKPKVYL